MTKEDFITYVRAIIDMEIETAKRTNPIFPKDERYKTVEGLKEFVSDTTPPEPQYELIGALKLIEEALSKVNETSPSPSYPPTITLPHNPPNLMPPFYPGVIGVPNTSPDWTYRPEHQPYYTINCTTSTANPTKK
jgi:hypothetical protein